MENGIGEYLRAIYNYNIFGKKIYDYTTSTKYEEIDYDETLDKIEDRVLIRYINRRKIIVWAIRVHLIISMFTGVLIGVI